MRSSLRLKITALTIGALLITFASVSLVSRSLMRQESDAESVETMFLIAEDTARSLEKYTDSVEQSVEMTASMAIDELDSTILVRGGVVGPDAYRKSVSEDDTAELDEHFASYCDKLQQTAATIASHTRGIMAYYYCISPDISTSVHGFFYAKAGKSGFGEREPLDARTFDRDDPQHYMWYYTTIQRGRPSWVGPYAATLLDEMQICSYLVPIYKAGTFVGVLGMDVPVSTLIEEVSSISVYETGFAALLDSEGKVVYHPDLEYGALAELSLPEDVDILEQETSGRSLIRYEVNGEERQLAFTTLSNGMKLLVVAPTAEINASANTLARLIVELAVVIVALSAIAVMLVMREVTQPLEDLTEASHQLAMGDYDMDIAYGGHDEVGELTSSFMQMRDRIKEYIEGLSRRVITDDLTGLPNQRHFYDLAEAERVRLLEADEHPVMLHFDLMGMKHYNRQYGFDEGDALIFAFSHLLAEEFGLAACGRLGQDHFAAVSSEERAETQVHEVFWQSRELLEGRMLPISVGIYPDSVARVEASVACDFAKYAADTRGVTYVSGLKYFDESMLRGVQNGRHVINHLDQALAEHWIDVYYQPIVDAQTGEVCDEEALSRWIDPELGFLSPAEFIPALEDAGLIYLVDLYVVDRVLEKLCARREQGLPLVAQSINLSRADFAACDCVDEISRRVDAVGIEHGLISIEITESVIGENFDFMSQQIGRFHALGFPVWMDDFGSGYSSLDVLQRIDFDLIKFDMSFMRSFNEGPSGQVILQRTMQMATELGVDTLCEGVETPEQHAFLRKIGCKRIQGYLFGKPAPYVGEQGSSTSV